MISSLQQMYSRTPTVEELEAYGKEIDGLPLKAESTELATLIKSSNKRLISILRSNNIEVMNRSPLEYWGFAP